MDISLCDDGKIWDDIIQEWKKVSFLQSWTWGTFQKRKGAEPIYLLLKEGDEIIGASLVIKVNSKRGTYFECIGGPLFKRRKSHYFSEWFKHIRKIARDRGVVFLRLRLPVAYNATDLTLIREMGFVPTELYYQAELTRMLDISMDEEQLLQQMKKKTRYEIRRTEREGVILETYTQDDYSVEDKELNDAFDIFLSLYQQMVERQKYIGYSKLYLKTQFDLFFSKNQASLYLAKHGDEYIGASIFFHYGNTTFYHHSASIPRSKVTAPSLVIWQAIKDAKRRGHMLFDLFGIVPPHPRYASRTGLSAFKAGFGGYEYQWMRTHDYVFRPLQYQINVLIEKMPSSLRRFGRDIVAKIR